MAAFAILGMYLTGWTCWALEPGPPAARPLQRRRRDGDLADREADMLTLHASTDRHDEWDGPRRYVRIIVHDTAEELRAAASRYRDDTGDWTGTAACFHPADTRWRYDEDGVAHDISDPHYAGLLRLSRDEGLSTEVVTHECVHAGATIYRMDVCTMIRLENGCGEREETLAYIIGDLTASVCNPLHDAGVWA